MVIHVSTVNKPQWTVVTAPAGQDTLVLDVTVSVLNMGKSSTDGVIARMAGGVLCVTYLDAQEKKKTVPVMEPATVQRIFVLAISGGLEKVVRFPTALALPTVSVVDFAMQQLNHQNVRTVVKAGWVQHVMTLVRMVFRYQWTAATVCVIQDTLEQGATVSAQSTARSLVTEHANAIQAGGEMFV